MAGRLLATTGASSLQLEACSLKLAPRSIDLPYASSITGGTTMKDDIARAETVGSLLRPDYVREMRQGIRNGTVHEEQRRAVEDRAVLEAIELQERVGLDVITDGELRRTSWITTAPQTTDVTHKHPFDGFKVVEGGGPGWICPAGDGLAGSPASKSSGGVIGIINKVSNFLSNSCQSAGVSAVVFAANVAPVGSVVGIPIGTAEEESAYQHGDYVGAALDALSIAGGGVSLTLDATIVGIPAQVVVGAATSAPSLLYSVVKCRLVYRDNLSNKFSFGEQIWHGNNRSNSCCSCRVCFHRLVDSSLAESCTSSSA